MFINIKALTVPKVKT